MHVALVSLDISAEIAGGGTGRMKGSANSYLGLGSLKAYALKDLDIAQEVRFISLLYTLEEPVSLVASAILQTDPQIVGFSSFIWNHARVLEISAEIKKRRKDVRVLLGGPMVSHYPDRVRKLFSEHLVVDIAVIGEGEITFHELLRHYLRSEKQLEDIQGLAFRLGDEIVVNEERPVIADLSVLPSPYLSGAIEIQPGGRGVTSLETSRGCPFQCAYCEYYCGSEFRAFPLERVEKELSFLCERLFSGYLFVADPLINFDVERAKAIFRMMAKCSFPIILELKPEFMDMEMVELLAAIPKAILRFGIQSTNPQVLRNIRRSFRADKSKELLSRLASYGGRNTFAELILGLPGDNYDSFKESLDWVLSCMPRRVHVFDLLVLENSPMMRQVEAYGIKYNKSEMNKVISTDSFSQQDIAKATQLRTILYSVQPYGRVFRVLQETVSMKPSRILEKLLETAISKGMISQRRYAEYERIAVDRDLLREFVSSVYSEAGCDYPPEPVCELFSFEKERDELERAGQALEKLEQRVPRADAPGQVSLSSASKMGKIPQSVELTPPFKLKLSEEVALHTYQYDVVEMLSRGPDACNPPAQVIHVLFFWDEGQLRFSKLPPDIARLLRFCHQGKTVKEIEENMLPFPEHRSDVRAAIRTLFEADILRSA